MSNIMHIHNLLKANPDMEPEDILFLLDSYYSCPKDEKGKRLGPLVGYAGKYAEGKQFVGDIYLNFAPVEEYWFILDYLAKRLYNALCKRWELGVGVYCGAPEGGKALALALSSYSLGSRYVYPDIKVTAPATSQGREKRELVWGRHQVNHGERVAIVEDLNNNFSTTDELINLILNANAQVVAIISYYNRSLDCQGKLYKYRELGIPIITLKSNPISQYYQEDPFVAEDVAKGNVVWKPKLDWAKLKTAMEAVRK